MVETLSPELEERVQQIALQVAREQTASLRTELMDSELGKLRTDMNAQFQRVWQSIEGLAEAQKRTEQRVGRLEIIVEELAEGQNNLVQRVNELAEAQKRTEQRLEKLAQAQERTERRLDSLAERMEQLTSRVDKLAEVLDQTNKQVGQLSQLIGYDVEEDMVDVVRRIAKEKDYHLLTYPLAVTINGEVDVVAHVETPQGERYWIVVEAKARLRRKEMGKWLQKLGDESFRLKLSNIGVDPPYLPYMYGRRIYMGVDEMAAENKIGTMAWHGERVEPEPWE